MASILVLLVGGLVALGALAVVVVLVVALTRSSPPPPSVEIAQARAHAATTSGLAAAATALVLVLLFVGVGALNVVQLPLPIGSMLTLLACAPLLASLAGLLVLLGGELTWPRPSGTSRTAVLADRSARSVAGSAWTRTAAALVVLGSAALLAGGLLGDETGGGLTRTWDTGARTAGPFPGWQYVTPQLVALGLCVVVAAVTLRAVVRRSAVVTADPETDLLLRRASVARVGRSLVVGTLVVVGCDLFVGGWAASRVYDDGAWHTVALVATLAGPLLALSGLVCQAIPTPRLPHPAAASVPPSTRISA